MKSLSLQTMLLSLVGLACTACQATAPGNRLATQRAAAPPTGVPVQTSPATILRTSGESGGAPQDAAPATPPNTPPTAGTQPAKKPMFGTLRGYRFTRRHDEGDDEVDESKWHSTEVRGMTD